MSHRPTPAATKAITVRVEVERLRGLMRARKLHTQSELIHALLEEEEERLRSEKALRDTEGTMRAADFDDRLL